MQTLDVWLKLTTDEWQAWQASGEFPRNDNEYDGMWQDDWFRAQMQQRTVGYDPALPPQWGLFDPVFPSPIATKLIADWMVADHTKPDEKRPCVVVNLRLARNRVTVLPESLYLSIFNGFYFAEKWADYEAFDALADPLNNTPSDKLPPHFQEQIRQSWVNALDRLDARPTLRHRKGYLTDAVFGEVSLGDVSTALLLHPDFLLSPPYEWTPYWDALLED